MLGHFFYACSHLQCKYEELQPPDSLENLKMVLNVVAEILTSGMQMELE